MSDRGLVPNQGNIGINCPGWAQVIKCRGGQLCDWAGRGKCDTPVMISPPLSRCHAVSRITWRVSGRMTLFVCDGLPIREPPDILTSGSQRMTVSGTSGTSRSSPDSRPSSIYGDINKSHSSRYESKFPFQESYLRIIKIDKCGHLVQFKTFLCVNWTLNSIVSVSPVGQARCYLFQIKPSAAGLLWSPGCLTLFPDDYSNVIFDVYCCRLRSLE